MRFDGRTLYLLWKSGVPRSGARSGALLAEGRLKIDALRRLRGVPIHCCDTEDMAGVRLRVGPSGRYSVTSVCTPVLGRNQLTNASNQPGPLLTVGDNPSLRSTSLESTLRPPIPATAFIIDASRILLASLIFSSLSDGHRLRAFRS